MSHEREPADQDRQPLEDPARAPHASRAHALSPWRRRAWLTDVGDADCTARLGFGTDDLLGWSACDMSVVPAAELVHPDDRERVDTAADAAARGGSPAADASSSTFTPLEVRLLARDRRYWWTRWDLRRADDGSVRGVGVDYVAPDGSFGPPVGTWQLDVDADVASWSTELLDMFGLVLGPPTSYGAFLDFVLDDDRAEVDRAVRRSIASDRSYAITFRCPLPCGRERWLHATSRRYGESADGHRRVGGLVKYLNPPGSGRPLRANIGNG